MKGSTGSAGATSTPQATLHGASGAANGNGAESAAHDGAARGGVVRVRLPTVAKAAADMSQADRAASASLLESTGHLERSVEQGSPAVALAAEASSLFLRLQGCELAPMDASGICTSLRHAKRIMGESHAFAQGPLIPVHQSEAEGQISRSLDLVELAVQASHGPDCA